RGRAALAAPALDAALRLLRRQVVRRHHVRVVDAAYDDRLIGIAFLERDDHLLVDARDVDRAPVASRPVRPDADPARAVDVVLPLAVPVELHLHAAVLVGEDLLPRRTDDDRGLRPL